MILNAFKNQRPTTLGLLILVALGLWSFAIFDTSSGTEAFPPSIYYWFIHFIEGVPFIQPLMAVVLIIVQAIMINNIVIESQLISTRSYVPSFVYVVLMSSTPELLQFHPGLIGNFFFILMLNRLFKSYRSESSFAMIFDAGIFLGLASTLNFSYIFILLFGWIALSILRSFVWRDWIIYVLGILVPYCFIATYYFAFDNLDNLYNHFLLFGENRIYQEVKMPLSYLPAGITFVGLMLLCTKSAFLDWRTSVIKVKKLHLTLMIFSIFALLIPLLVSGLSLTAFTPLAIPLCIYLSNHFINTKKPLVAEVSFLLLLISIVYLHIVTL